MTLSAGKRGQSPRPARSAAPFMGVEQILRYGPRVGSRARLMEGMLPAQRRFYESTPEAVRPLVQRWSGKSLNYATVRAIREAIKR